MRVAHASGGELVEQGLELRAIEDLGVVVQDGVAVALLPVAEEVGVQRGRPRDAALEEHEPQVGVARGTPPKNSERAAVSAAAAKLPRWL